VAQASDVAREPALTWITALSVVAATIIRLVHLTGNQASYIGVAAVVLGTILTAILTRPVGAAAISGLGGAAVAALASFGLHLSADQIAVVVAAVGLLVGIVVRMHLTPVVTLRGSPVSRARAAEPPEVAHDN
jgi:hypothetical protein